MSEGSITQKLSTEGADMLTLAGVNDGNLVELSRLGGVKVALRGDTMTISGPAELVTRASDIARRMIDRARQRMEDGWTYGPRRCDEARTHPCLVAYEELPEHEKVYDRNAALGTLKAVIASGYRIVVAE